MKTGTDGKKLRTSGEVCRTIGIKPSSLRVYEEKKPRLVKPTRVKEQNSNRTDARGMPVRLRNKWYGAPEVLRVMLIVMCRQLGFGLNEIGELLDRTDETRVNVLQKRLRELEAERARIDRQINLIHILLDFGDAGAFVSAMLDPDIADINADMIENIRSVEEKSITNGKGQTEVKAGKKNARESSIPQLVYDSKKTELIRIAKKMKKLINNGYRRTPETDRLADEAETYLRRTYALDEIIPEPDSLLGHAVMLLPVTAFLTGGGEVTQKIEEAAGKDIGWMIAAAVAHKYVCGAVERLRGIRAEYAPDEAGKTAFLDDIRSRTAEKLSAWHCNGRMADEWFAYAFGDEKKYREICDDLIAACEEPDLTADDTFPGIFICMMEEILGGGDKQ